MHSAGAKCCSRLTCHKPLTSLRTRAQVNLDFSSEEDMVRKFRVGLALQVWRAVRSSAVLISPS